MIEIEELKQKAGVFFTLFPGKHDVYYMSIEDYVFSTLGGGKEQHRKS